MGLDSAYRPHFLSPQAVLCLLPVVSIFPASPHPPPIQYLKLLRPYGNTQQALFSPNCDAQHALDPGIKSF